VNEPSAPGFILSGPRRSGKSSVLERLEHLIAADAQVSRVDLLSVLGHAEVWPAGTVVPAVLQSLLDVLERQFGAIPNHCRALVEQRDFDLAMLERIGTRRLVVLFDEMEVAQVRDPIAPLEIASALLPLPGFPVPRPFIGLVWGRPFGRGFARELPSLYKDFFSHELHRFSNDETRQALLQPLAGFYQWNDAAVAATFGLTQGHPLFTAAIGACVHAERLPGDRRDVDAAEVVGAVDKALIAAGSWEDAWRQLTSRQQILLRSIAEDAGPSMIQSIIDRARNWGAPYDKVDFDTSSRGLYEDGLLHAAAEGLQYQVPMIRRWIVRKSPADILGSPDDPRLLSFSEAARHEEEGRRHRRQQDPESAQRSFRAAIELDPTRWSAAVWLGEVLLELGRAEEGADVLRTVTPTSEVRRIRARLLEQCLRQAQERHEDLWKWVAELRLVDPLHEEAPEAAALIASLRVDEWWQGLQGSTAQQVLAATSDLFAHGSEVVIAALRHSRSVIESAMENAAVFDERLLRLVGDALPHLLREAEPSAESAGQPWSEMRDEWQRCYFAEVRTLAILGAGSAQFGNDVPPSALLRLIECRVATTADGKPVRDLVMRIATARRLVELAITDASLARTAATLLESVARISSPHEISEEAAEVAHRLVRAFTDASLAATQGSSGQIECAYLSLPAVGASVIRLREASGDAALSNEYLRDLIAASEYVLDRMVTDPACAPLRDERPMVEDWLSILRSLVPLDPAKVGRLITILESWSAPRESAEPIRVMQHVIDAAAIKSILGEAYQPLRALQYSIHRVPPGYVWAWEVERLGRRFLARVYRVEGGDDAFHSLLKSMWESERRLLSTLATRSEGRALPRLQMSRFDPDRGALIMVTDLIGPQTLRDLLSAGEIEKVRRTSRAKLWAHLQGLIEALAALHRAGYIHRAVRPENVLIDTEDLSRRGAWLRLANFEWSVYVYGIASTGSAESVLYDRYVAPETVAMLRGASADNPHIGEGTSSDIFSLGLMLFECIVAPLNRVELRSVPHDYSVDHHVEWISDLLKAADEAYRAGSLWEDELSILKQLLAHDVTHRMADLDSLLDRVSKLAQRETVEQAIQIDAALPLVTAMRIGTPESISRFIQQELPTVRFKTPTELEEWIADQLKKAVIRPNRRAGAPLLLEGRLLNFTVEPFRFHGRTYPHIGWLKVAKEHDGPVGEAVLGSLPGVELHNYRRDLPLGSLLISREGWSHWFKISEHLHDSLTLDEKAFLDRVRWSVELEKSSWKKQVLPYELTHYEAGARPGEPDKAIIRDRGDEGTRRKGGSKPKTPGQAAKDDDLRTYKLGDLMAASADHDNTWFELGRTRDPTASFHSSRLWIQVRSDEDREEIHLIRNRRGAGEPPPQKGMIRPYSMAGQRTIYQRRRDVIDDLEHDPFLVKAILTPSEVFDDLNMQREQISANLDEDKRELSSAIQNRLPLFVVQGPPGTGKTTLAAEVILRTLHDQPSSRILVVSQSHDPLNHLLERVAEALEGWKRKDARRPTMVRLVREERLDERRYGSEAVRVPRKYHPSRVAAQIMADASVWKPGPDDIRTDAIGAWRRLAETHALEGLSRSLETRLIRSSSIVFATANDRRLPTLRPGSFDLVIYEEAAKALPAEVLGPLRLARRWLLIGDQAQLPPFGLEDLEMTLKEDLAQRRSTMHAKNPAAGVDGIDPAYILGGGAPPPDLWAGIHQEMTRLLRFFGYVYDRAARVPLPGREPMRGPADGEPASPPAVSGLAGMLTTQWRMHPVIGDFVSKCFYDGRVKNGDPKKMSKKAHGCVLPEEIRDQVVVWLDVPWAGDDKLAADRHGFGGGWENAFEARVVLGFLRKLTPRHAQKLELAILSPYRAQVNALGALVRDFRTPVGGDLSRRLHTADSFQGKQADVVVVSLVRNNIPVAQSTVSEVRRGLGFLESQERSTVIFSRAEQLLVIVGSLGHFKRFPNTSMYKVATEMEKLASKPGSGGRILKAEDFIEPQHRRDLERFLTRQAERRSQRDLATNTVAKDTN
jgi:serine/threonine protein kinase